MNWIRRTVQSIERASDLASMVLPTPGTSSSRRWPSASNTVTARRTTSGLPSITRSTAWRIMPVACSKPSIDIGGLVVVTMSSFGRGPLRDTCEPPVSQAPPPMGTTSQDARPAGAA